MIQPKPYPPTDSAEQNAKVVFENLVDRSIVKADIRTRDKYPNIDGTIELVDERQAPIGKFDIQLRSIPKGQTSYPCETSLVAYSTSSTLPVLLICVDSANEYAYWKHINAAMPEFKGKETQKSFTIHFLAASDGIDQTGTYIQKWIEITRDYQERIALYPMMSSQVANKLELKAIDPKDRELFQRYIDTVNGLLDREFVVIKELLFPGTWKLGVGIVSSDQSHVQYQLYTIPYGTPSPLVCKLDRGFLFTHEWSPSAVFETLAPRDTISDPSGLGTDFVLERVRNAVEKTALPIYGKVLSADILIAFVDLYHRLIGISPNLDHYLVQDLAYALNQHLVRMGAAIVRKITPGTGAGFVIDLDWFSNYLATNRIEPITPNQPTVYFSFTSSINFPVRAPFDSLRYLLANKVVEIDRPFGRRDLVLSQGRKWIWSGYSREKEIESVTYILKHSLEEYSAFVSGNRFHFPNSPYFDSDIAIVFEYEPVGTTSVRGPGLREHHIDNTSHLLPKLSIFVRDQNHHCVDTSRFPNIELDGKVYSAHSSSSSIADFFFHRTPVLKLIYRMLSSDLKRHYNMTMLRTRF
jgi:hypothetical protein